jgi:two-component system, cell cycle sensor histidine kinase and response regulator CckA
MSSTQAAPGTQRVLVITNHRVLGKAIETGLWHLAQIELYNTGQEPALPTSFVERYGIPDLIIFTQLSRSPDPAGAQELAAALDGYEQVPMLLICEEPSFSGPRGDLIHYLGFPFALPELQAKVAAILESQSAGTIESADAESPTRVLIVEDEFIVAADLKAMLEHLGYSVMARLSRAEDAVTAVRRDPPDLVLMDIHLAGEMDGIQAAGMIHAETDVPVIFLTAHADNATLTRAKATAPYGYILKPFDEHDVNTGIQIALRRIQDERAIRERERWLRAVLRSIGDGVIATDADDRIVFLNPVAERLIGRKWDRALGQRLEEIFPHFGNEADNTAYGAEDGSMTGALRLMNPDKREILLDHTRSPIEDDYGNREGQIVSLRDVTEQVGTRRLLQERAEELLTQNEELGAFAHTVAHDIKDPLNIIYGYSSVLADGYVEMDAAATRQSLQTIARYALKTCKIVDELLLLAQVRDADIELEPLDMPTILIQAQQRLADRLEESGAGITQDSGTWPQAVGYGPWVEEIWVNLLSNGIKYGGKPPELKIGAMQIGGNIRFWVTDNGQGIAEELQQQLFVPFTQLPRLRVTGHGLGLSIVQRIISRLGGTVGVESSLGEGSTFYFDLPARKAALADTEEIEEKPTPRAAAHPPARQTGNTKSFARNRVGAGYEELSVAQ